MINAIFALLTISVLLVSAFAVSENAFAYNTKWKFVPKVCGEKLCDSSGGSTSDDEREKHREELVNPTVEKIEIIVELPPEEPEPITIEPESTKPPLKQINSGVEPTQVTCTEGLELVLKVSNGKPACLKPSSVSKLIERGWAIHILPDYEKNKDSNSEIFTLGEFQVDTMDVNYFQNSKGYLAKPNIDGQYPAVIMIHEWWGLNENIRDMAEKLASHGYVVLAVDLYDGQVATTSDEARQLISSFDEKYWVENMNLASSYIQKQYSPQKIGSIGWCFGGGQSLNLALNNDDIDATVIYYGQLVSEKEVLSTINWPVLGIFAELDQGIPPEQVNEFEAALNELDIPNDIYIYPDVNHAFANPSGERYAPEASMDAWQKTIEFLEMNLK